MNGETLVALEDFHTEQAQGQAPARGKLLVASCRSGTYLASRVVQGYRNRLADEGSQAEVVFLEDIDQNFSDTETSIRLDQHVGGCDVFLVQGLYNPVLDYSVNQSYMAFLIAARAFREHGARHVTGVLPYLAYARQDKPARFTREPTTAKLMADLSLTAGIDRLVTWHPHSGQIHGFYGRVPVDILDALGFFAREYKRFSDRTEVAAVAPDAGASKFVTYVARQLGLRSAIAAKYRPEPEKARVSELIGDLAGKRVAIVLDDMISSGGTMHAIVKKLVVEKGVEEVYVGASHNLCMPAAHDRLVELHEEYALRQVVVTNSIPQSQAFQELPFFEIRDLSEILTLVINRIHYNQSVSDLLA
jgi:ribose-phosphate pyrophosphokinase